MHQWFVVGENTELSALHHMLKVSYREIDAQKLMVEGTERVSAGLSFLEKYEMGLN